MNHCDLPLVSLPHFFIRVLVKFVVSNKSCSIPPEFRVDPYRCEESMLEDIGKQT